MTTEGLGSHTEEKVRASGTNLMIEVEEMKRKQSASTCEDVKEFATELLEDVIIRADHNVPTPSMNVDEFSLILRSYLGQVAISEQSLEVSGDLWKSEEQIPSGLASTVSHKSFQLNNEKPEGKFFSIVPKGEEEPQTCFAEKLSEEQIPSGLASTVSHKSFQLNNEKPEGKFFSIVPKGEEEPQTCFAEKGEETPPKSECFCQANLRAFESSSTESGEVELMPESILSNGTSTMGEYRVSFTKAAEAYDFCDQFDSVDAIASKFVGWLLKRAVAAVSSDEKQRDEGETEVLCSVLTFVESCGFSWPMIKDFTEEVGNITVREYIATWFYSENWMYNIKLVLKQSDENSDYFTYETIWGIPTKQYPVPQVTASIFFVIEVCRVKPVNCLVDITYYYEGCSYVQAPFVNFFNEKQLSDIVNAKLKFYKQLRF